MLELRGVSISVEGKKLLENVNLRVGDKEIVAIIGPNGSGKSSLLKAIAGYPKVSTDKGVILLNGKNITNLDPEDRFKMGIFLTFQDPSPIPVRTIKVIEVAYNKLHGRLLEEPLPQGVLEEIKNMLKYFNLKEELLYKEIHTGFSGGEKKKIESLIAFVLKPIHPLFDEPDTGLDINSIKLLSKKLNEMKKHSGIVLVTHNLSMLDYVHYDRLYLVKGGTVKEISRIELENIKNHGY